MRSRSRSKQVRSGSGSSGAARSPAPVDNVAPGASSSCSASSRACLVSSLAPTRGLGEWPWARTISPAVSPVGIT